MFEHTKVGDVVLVIREIRIKGYSGVNFAVKDLVRHTTKTQIMVSGIRYYRKNGKAVGDWNQGVFNLGDDLSNRRGAHTLEEVSMDEFMALNTFARRYRELADVFLPHLKAPELTAIFRRKDLREQIARDAKALRATFHASLDKILPPKK